MKDLATVQVLHILYLIIQKWDSIQFWLFTKMKLLPIYI